MAKISNTNSANGRKHDQIPKALKSPDFRFSLLTTHHHLLTTQIYTIVVSVYKAGKPWDSDVVSLSVGISSPRLAPVVV